MNASDNLDASDLPNDIHRLRMQEGWTFLTGMLIAGQVNGASPIVDRPVVLLTILSGFLGSGKTTLLNQLLANPGGRRILVLVNDFAQINIDEKLIESRDSEVLMLTNGCACCSLAGELATKLVEVCAAPHPPEAILLEASGLADPHGLAHVALSNPQIRLDGIVTVVDASAMRECENDPITREVFRTQMAAADLVVLNKIDLMPPEGLEESIQWLQQFAEGKPLLRTHHAAVPTDIVMGIGRTRQDVPQASVEHLRDFESWSVSSVSVLDPNLVRAWLARMPETIIRAKGIIWVDGTPPARVVYQKVGKRWEFTQTPINADSTGVSSVVFIGRKGTLTITEVQAGIDGCASQRRTSCTIS